MFWFWLLAMLAIAEPPLPPPPPLAMADGPRRLAPRGQFFHYELWRTPGKLGAPMPFQVDAHSSSGQPTALLLPHPPAQPLHSSRRVAFLRSKEAAQPACRARCSESESAQPRPALQVAAPRLDATRGAAAADEGSAMPPSPASAVFSVLTEAQSGGRVDVRLLGKCAAAAQHHRLR